MAGRRIRMLIVDDERGFRDTMQDRFERRGFEVTAAPDAEVALNLLAASSFDVALFDVRMPGMDGITLLRQARDRWPLLEVIIVTGQGSIESAIEATKSGAYGYVTKPLRRGELDAAIERALEHAALSRDRKVKDRALRRLGVEDFVYRSAEMKALAETAANVATSDATLLLEGETGTGKEVLATYIHRRSARSDGPFVVLDCGTLAGSILERELFGHERGAYTGADESRPGLVSLAEGGTLLIDEIAHTSAEVQAKLLRLIERRTFRRLGDPHETRADMRLLAATNQDLERKVGQDEFRADLFHRLNVLRLRVPPLRDRKDDILPLASYFLSRYSPVMERPKRLGPDAETALMVYAWPGNVRELSNVVQRACLITSGEEIDSSELGIDTAPPEANGPLSLRAAERRHIESVLATTQGDKARAAELLGITLRHLYRKLQKHGLG
ncbi:MAG: sigma-54-dependent transcriptional regulator [Planctomycetota bacterium]